MTPLLLKALFTLKDGEHRIHVNGQSEAIAELWNVIQEEVFKGSITVVPSRGDVLSVPEANGAALMGMLRRAGASGSKVASQVFIALDEERPHHVARYPGCPSRDEPWPTRSRRAR